eukprot:10174584-Alexandrium_andersonii.AAC.1
MRASVRVCAHAWVHAAYECLAVDACERACGRAYVLACSRACARVRVRACVCARVRMCAYVLPRVSVRTCARVRASWRAPGQVRVRLVRSVEPRLRQPLPLCVSVWESVSYTHLRAHETSAHL